MCHRPENDQKASRHKSNESHHRKSDDNTRFGQSSKRNQTKIQSWKKMNRYYFYMHSKARSDRFVNLCPDKK